MLTPRHRNAVVACRWVAVAAAAAFTLAGCAGNLECNGHPCVGSWKRDMALGGSVVQWVDGKWSHAGGFGRACSGHGGERRGGRTRR